MGRIEDERMLKDYQEKGRNAVQRVDELKKQFQAAQVACSRMQLEASRAESLVIQHRKPNAATFPTKEDLSAWEKEHADLLANLHAVWIKRSDATQQLEHTRHELFRASADVQNLMWAVAQLNQRLGL